MRIRWKHVLRLGFVAVLCTALVVAGLLTWVSQVYASRFAHMGCFGERLGLAELGYPSTPVTFVTRQGYALRGWFSAGMAHPETAIVVLQGASGNTEFALPDAEILAEAGYTTLIYEHRSCANPDLLHSGGYFEAYDLISAVDYLTSRHDVRHVGVVGFSVGGTAALLAAAEDPRIEAVVAMGGFSSLEADVLEPNTGNGPLDWTLRRLVFFFIGRELGVPLSLVNPESRIRRISPRPLLLVYGEEEAWNGEALYAAAQEPKELWIVPGIGHGGYREAYPTEYRTRILEFLHKAFHPSP